MNKIELKKLLDFLGINPKEYSLEGELNTDTIVLYQNYRKWEVFYLDERGGRNNEKNFNSENDACLYIYNEFKELKEIRERFNLNY